MIKKVYVCGKDWKYISSGGAVVYEKREDCPCYYKDSPCSIMELSVEATGTSTEVPVEKERI